MPVLDTGKDHRKGNEVVCFCFLPLVLREEEAPLASYPNFLFSYATPLRPPLLRTEGPAVTAIAIWDHDGLTTVATPIECSCSRESCSYSVLSSVEVLRNQRHVPRRSETIWHRGDSRWPIQSLKTFRLSWCIAASYVAALL